jgi:hypothetical protein
MTRRPWPPTSTCCALRLAPLVCELMRESIAPMHAPMHALLTRTGSFANGSTTWCWITTSTAGYWETRQTESRSPAGEAFTTCLSLLTSRLTQPNPEYGLSGLGKAKKRPAPLRGPIRRSREQAAYLRASSVFAPFCGHVPLTPTTSSSSHRMGGTREFFTAVVLPRASATAVRVKPGSAEWWPATVRRLRSAPAGQ